MRALLTLPVTTTVVLLFMAVHARLIEAVAAGRLPRATVGALAVPGGLSTFAAFHAANPQARVVLVIVASTCCWPPSPTSPWCCWRPLNLTGRHDVRRRHGPSHPTTAATSSKERPACRRTPPSAHQPPLTTSWG